MESGVAVSSGEEPESQTGAELTSGPTAHQLCDFRQRIVNSVSSASRGNGPPSQGGWEDSVRWGVQLLPNVWSASLSLPLPFCVLSYLLWAE